MDFFGKNSKRARRLKEQDEKFRQFQEQMEKEDITFEKGDYLAMVLGAFWALWPALAVVLAIIIGVGLLFM